MTDFSGNERIAASEVAVDAGYSPDGPNFQVNTTAQEGQINPSITGLAGGGFVVVWEDNSSIHESPGALGGDASINVRGQVFSAAGAPVGGEFLVNTTIEKTQFQPSVAALTDGGFIVVWEDFSTAPSFSEPGAGDFDQIRAQRYAADGTPSGGEFVAHSNDDSRVGDIKVAGLANGGFVITWTHSVYDHELAVVLDDTEIRGQIYDASGNIVEVDEETDFAISTLSEYVRDGADVVGLAGGGFVVSWTDFGVSESGDDNDDGAVVARIFANDGTSVGDEFQINTVVTAGQFDVDLAALAGGGFVATWSDESEEGGGASIKGQVYAADGTPVGAEFLIAQADTDFGTELTPSVSTLLDGGFVVTWQVPPTETAPVSLQGQVFSASGALVGEQFRIDNSGASYHDNPDVTGLAGGGFAVAWDSFTYEENGVPGQDVSDSAITAQVYTTGVADPYDGVTVNGGIGRDKITPLKALPGQPLPGALRDKLFGFESDDTLDGGAGGDLMTGGAGNDKYVLDDVLDLVVEEEGGGDRDLMQSSVINLLLAANVENGTLLGLGNLGADGNGLENTLTGNDGKNLLRGFGGDDTLKGNAGIDTILGGADNDRIDGGSEADNLYGDEGKDRLVGGAGEDYLSGGEGDDTLDGGTEADSMEGGIGNDKYTVDDAGDTVIEYEGEGDKDSMQSATVSFALAANVENGTLTGTDALDITGNDLANRLKGNDGDNELTGGAGIDTLGGDDGADTLRGGTENDSLTGNAGDDFLYGDENDDTLTGGAGSDHLTGGSGADRFNFGEDAVAIADIDVIEDFSGKLGEGDRISLAGIDSNGIEADGNGKFAFIGTGAFTGTAGQLRYSAALGQTVIEADIDGDSVADFSIILTGEQTLLAADFLL